VLTAWRLLERFDEPMIEAIFAQFLVISEDPAMKWTTELNFVLESVFGNLGNPTDMTFHRQEIIKRSTSSVPREKGHEPTGGQEDGKEI
jgi:hypothetical protein